MNIQRQARNLAVRNRQRNHNRQQSMLSRSVEKINLPNVNKENLK